jgi:2-dehydropantoate 2-reductase
VERVVARILVIGAGAIGGLLAVRLSLAGHSVSAFTRGAQLDAIRASGCLTLQNDHSGWSAPVEAIGSLDDASPADWIFVTLKAHQLPALAPSIARLAKGSQALVPIQNGIPWWYFLGHGGPHEAHVVQAVDPEGRLMSALRGCRLVPGLALIAAEVVRPGVIFNVSSKTDALEIGPVGSGDAHLAEHLVDLVAAAGLGCRSVPIRTAVWTKLLGNIWANPIGALTGATVAEIATRPETRSLARALMGEVDAVARAWGIEVGVDFDARLERAISLRQGIRSSMLQDVERGRPTERAALLEAVIELGQLADVQTPHIAALNALIAIGEAGGFGRREGHQPPAR